MKLSTSLSLAFAAILLTASAAIAAPAAPASPQAVPAVAGLQLATPAAGAPSCDVGALAFLPAPLNADTPVLCGRCSSPFCKGKALGAFCGPTTIGRCVIGPACTLGGVTCLCQP
jgi:hypothetical protein